MIFFFPIAGMTKNSMNECECCLLKKKKMLMLRTKNHTKKNRKNLTHAELYKNLDLTPRYFYSLSSASLSAFPIPDKVFLR